MCGPMVVAQLMQRVDGSWYALLSPSAEPLGPVKTRSCVSRKSGVAGIEAWATRNAARLRNQAEVCDQRMARLRHPAVPVARPAPGA